MFEVSKKSKFDAFRSFTLSHPSFELIVQIFILVSLVLLVLLNPLAAYAADSWSMYQHDAKHTGRSQYVGPLMPSVKWVVPFGGTGKPTTPITVTEDGKLYVGVAVSGEGKDAAKENSSQKSGAGHSGVFAFNDKSKILWVSKVNGIVSGPIAVGKDGTVYAVIGKKLAALDKKDGSAKWKLDLNGESTGGVSIGKDGIIYVGTLTGQTLYAVTKDGKIKWQYKAGSNIDCSPAVADDGKVYITTVDLYLHAIDSNGILISKQKVTSTPKTVLTSPVIGPDGTVYCGAVMNKGYFDENDNKKLVNQSLFAFYSNGKLKWTYQSENKAVTMPAIAANGNVIVTAYSLNLTDDRELTIGDAYILSIKPNGQKDWHYHASDDALLGPALIDKNGSIYVSTPDGYMISVSGSGTMRWRYKIGGKMSLGPDGILYVAATGSIAAFKEKDLSKVEKTNEDIEKMESEKAPSINLSSVLIYLIPIAAAVSLGLFFKSRLSGSDTGSDNTETESEKNDSKE